MTTELIGSGNDDDITLSGTFLLSGTTSGVIDGAGGSDTLNLSSSNLENVTISGIEATNLANNGTQVIEAQQIENLGTIGLTGNGSTFGGSIQLRGDSGDTADFSGLDLSGTEELTVTSNFGVGTTLTSDFSAATFGGSSFVDYNGGSANESVTGGTGNDQLSGAGGNDTLIGGLGDDLIEDTSGTNDLQGGAGNDTISVSNNSATTVDGGADDDEININGTFTDGTVDGGAGNDTVNFSSANVTGTTFVNIETSNLANSGTLFIDAVQIENLGTINLTNNGSAFGGFIQLRGVSGDAADFSNLALSGTEELTVSSNFAAGTSLTSDFSAATFGGSSFVDYNGGSANESVTGGTGNDQISGGGGNDTLIGGLGDDLIEDTSGTNDLQGGGGNDTINSSSNATGSIDGGSDDDTINVSSTYTDASIDGGAGTDILNLSSANLTGTTISNIETTNLANNGTQFIDAVQIANLGSINLTGAGSSFGGFIQLRGASGDTADFSNLALSGTEELTVTNNFAAGTSLTSDFSAATFGGQSFIDYNGGSANEVVIGGTGNDQLSGGGGNDTLIGGLGDDLIEDTSGTNDLQGGAGNDTINSSSNTTGSIDAGADDDTINIASTHTDATIDGGSGTDTLNLTSANVTGTTFSGIEMSNLANNGTLFIDAVQVANLGTINLTNSGSAFGGFIQLRGTSGDAADFSNLVLSGTEVLTVSSNFAAGTTLTSDFSAAAFGGSSFIDYNGGSADEVVIGGTGNDQLSGSGGSDTLIGGLGDDQIDDSSGTNDLQGGVGDDTITASGNTFTTIDGGADDDEINITSTFTDGTVDGGAGNDTVNFSSANVAGTTFANVERSNLANNGTLFIDAVQIENLGTINLTNNGSAFGGFIQLRGVSGDAADFSDLELSGTEELAVSSNFTSGTSLTVDFSAGTFDGSSFIDYNGGAANERVTGGSADDQLSGSSGDDTLIGGLGDDLIDDFSGANDLQGGAGNDTITASSNSGTSVDGGADDDTINISSTFTNGAIEGGAGTDTLNLTSANLTGTTISGIENTNFANNGNQRIDAAQIANLGEIALTGNGAAFGGFLQLTNIDGQVVDLANLTLADNEFFRVSTIGNTTESVTVDLSNGTYGNNVTLEFFGSSAVDTVIASSVAEDLNGNFGADRLSYEASTSGVTVDLLNGTASGGFAEGDDISGFDNITGSSSNDLFNSAARNNDFDGGDGTDIVVFQGNRADYTIVELAGNTTVTDNNGFTNGFDGTVTTTRVEILRFADQDVVIVQPGLPQLTISGSPSLAEGDSGTTVFEFTVTRTGTDLSGTSSASFAVSGITADAGDFVGGVLPTGTVNFAAGETRQIISIPVQGDTVLEGDETFTVTLSNPVDAEVTGSASNTGTILDDDPLPTLSIAGAGILPEGDAGVATFEFVVTRAGDLSGESSSTFNVLNNGTNADDFGGVIPSGTVNFAAGEDTAVISIDVTGDVDPENNELFFVQLSAPTGATLATSTASATIENDDPFEPALLLSNATAQAEGDTGTTSFEFTVTRSGILTQASSADYVVSGGSADADDFGGTFPSGTVNFAAGEDTATITIDVTGDTDIESNESFVVTLSNPTNARIIDGVGVSTILNDDAPLPTLSIADAGAQEEGDTSTTDFNFTVTRSGDLSEASSAAYAVVASGANAADFGGALPSGTVTFAAGEDTAVITIEVSGDVDLEGDEQFLVSLSAPQNATIADGLAVATILNDDTTLSISDAGAQFEGDAGTTGFEFTVTRTGDLSQASSAAYQVSGGTADAADFGGTFPSGTVSFAAGEDTATITVNVSGDTDLEAAETFVVTLSGPTNATLADDTGTATILNDDSAPLPTLSIADAGAQAEGDAGTTSFAFTVTRAGDLSAASTAAYAVVAGDTDAADFGGALPSGTVSFAAGEDTAVITVDVTGDLDVEGDEAFSVVLSAPDNATLADDTGTATILNDDSAPLPTLS
ncbi:Calx-beta domain-containing protein, partial [uncultured Roseobacter sp.]|uniref:Calx-beta domain-containing protein n=1 Tax=uncultured Roseobacter sp. TaxID=114847 RepID=UPI0026238B9F